MIPLPEVAYVGVHQGRGVFGSFLDAEWVLHYIEAGAWTFRMEGRGYRVGPGDMVLIPPRLLHVVRQRSGPRRVQQVAHFVLGGRPPGQDVPFAVSLPPGDRPEAIRLFAGLRREWLGGRPQAALVCGGIVAQLLGLYFRHAPRRLAGEAAETLAWRNVEQAVEVLHARLAEPGLALADVARAAGVTPNYLCRIFKAHAGHAPMRYLALLRHSRAEELLLGSIRNCTEIAEATGHPGIHSFSRAFKRVSGLSPTEFRRRHARRLPGQD